MVKIVCQDNFQLIVFINTKNLYSNWRINFIWSYRADTQIQLLVNNWWRTRNISVNSSARWKRERVFCLWINKNQLFELWKCNFLKRIIEKNGIPFSFGSTTTAKLMDFRWIFGSHKFVQINDSKLWNYLDELFSFVFIRFRLNAWKKLE